MQLPQPVQTRIYSDFLFKEVTNTYKKYFDVFVSEYRPSLKTGAAIEKEDLRLSNCFECRSLYQGDSDLLDFAKVFHASFLKLLEPIRYMPKDIILG